MHSVVDWEGSMLISNFNPVINEGLFKIQSNVQCQELSMMLVSWEQSPKCNETEIFAGCHS